MASKKKNKAPKKGVKTAPAKKGGRRIKMLKKLVKKKAPKLVQKSGKRTGGGKPGGGGR